MNFINLYQPLHPKTKEILSAKNIIFLCAGFFLMLMLFYTYKSYTNRQFSTILSETEKRRTALEQTLATLQLERVDESELLRLKNEIETIEQEWEAKKQAIQLLSDTMLTNMHGFSQYLTAMAKQSREGLWLEKIKLSSGGEHIELSGKTKQPEFLFQYMQRLSNEAPIKGKLFNAFFLSQSPDTEGVLQFFLGTEKTSEVAESTG